MRVSEDTISTDILEGSTYTVLQQSPYHSFSCSNSRGMWAWTPHLCTYDPLGRTKRETFGRVDSKKPPIKPA